jgi:hypothetical protein
MKPILPDISRHWSFSVDTVDKEGVEFLLHALWKKSLVDLSCTYIHSDFLRPSHLDQVAGKYSEEAKSPFSKFLFIACLRFLRLSELELS